MEAAFEAGSGVATTALLAAIAGAVLAPLTLWVAWVTYGALRAWRAGEASLYELLWTVLRASILLLVAGFFIR